MSASRRETHVLGDTIERTNKEKEIKLRERERARWSENEEEKEIFKTRWVVELSTAESSERDRTN